MKKISYLIAISAALVIAACSNNNNTTTATESTESGERKLPFYGNRTTEVSYVNGAPVIDTIYQNVPEFKLTNQDGKTLTDKDVMGKVYVADFFFTSCPTICPVMKKEMIRVYEKFKGNKDVMILSHTIDPDYDTKEVLKDYATRLGSDGKQWQFLTGKRSDIYRLAEQGYYASVVKDAKEPGGYAHSGGFILVDRKLRVRGIYDGTNAADVDRLMEDLDILLEER